MTFSTLLVMSPTTTLLSDNLYPARLAHVGASLTSKPPAHAVVCKREGYGAAHSRWPCSVDSGSPREGKSSRGQKDDEVERKSGKKAKQNEHRNR